MMILSKLYVRRILPAMGKLDGFYAHYYSSHTEEAKLSYNPPRLDHFWASIDKDL